MQNGDQTSKEKDEDPHQGDIVQKSIGVLGKWHIWICLAIFLVKFPVAWHQLSIVFVAPRTDFYCADTALDKCNPNCTAHVFNRWENDYYFARIMILVLSLHKFVIGQKSNFQLTAFSDQLQTTNRALSKCDIF